MTCEGKGFVACGDCSKGFLGKLLSKWPVVELNCHVFFALSPFHHITIKQSPSHVTVPRVQYLKLTHTSPFLDRQLLVCGKARILSRKWSLPREQKQQGSPQKKIASQKESSCLGMTYTAI